MNSKRSRIAVAGVFALAICLTVGLVSGAAEAKKKKKKGGPVTVSRTTPTAIPATSDGQTPGSLTAVPLVVGKAAKGKVVAWNGGIAVTTSFTGSTGQALGNLRARITAPNGRTVSLLAPAWYGGIQNTVSGPLTETADSPFGICTPQPGPAPCPAGTSRDPEDNVGPPFAGTVGNNELAKFGGVPAKGTWTVKVFNGGVGETAVLNSVSITVALKKAPA